jgi:tRNA1(Val) A37 N6-methylase TrmN6
MGVLKRLLLQTAVDNRHQRELDSRNTQIAKSRKEANKIKREEPITVVIGNPPYKEKAKGRGGWVEKGDKNAKGTAP